MFKITQKGDFRKTKKLLEKAEKRDYLKDLNAYGQMGVEALKASTPVNSGKTADSWYYTIDEEKGQTIISWNNSNVNEGVKIAVIIQYGHGTGSGAYVRGIDYINPAMRPTFEQIADQAWKGVVSV